MTKELVTKWCITERVKRLAGNEIELGMKIPTMESRASNIPTDKGNYVCCHNGSTNKDLYRICMSQYGHPGSAIDYWPERCLGHVYIVLESVGSARLTFDDDIILYELCHLVTECCSESRMRQWTWRWVSKCSRHKDRYIGWLYSDIGKVPSDSGIFRSTGELWEFTGRSNEPYWAIQEKRRQAKGRWRPPMGPNWTRGRGRRPPCLFLLPLSFPLSFSPTPKR